MYLINNVSSPSSNIVPCSEQVTNKYVNSHAGETGTGPYEVTVGQSRASASVTLPESESWLYKAVSPWVESSTLCLSPSSYQIKVILKSTHFIESEHYMK